MKQISNNDKAKLVTAYTIFFNIPIDINDSMTLWCKSLEVEKGFKQPEVPQVYKVYYKKLDEKLRNHLIEQGFLLEGITISEWMVYSDIYKKVIKIILSMNKLRNQTTSETRKTASAWGIDVYKGKFRIVTIDFKRRDGWKKGRKKNAINLNDFDKIVNLSCGETKQRFNPFSRNFSVKFKRTIFKRDDYTCKYCGWKNGVSGKQDRILTLDHIIPISHGGTTKPNNLITSCLKCNIKKNDKIIESLFKIIIKDKPK